MRKRWRLEDAVAEKTVIAVPNEIIVQTARECSGLLDTIFTPEECDSIRQAIRKNPRPVEKPSSIIFENGKKKSKLVKRWPTHSQPHFSGPDIVSLWGRDSENPNSYRLLPKSSIQKIWARIPDSKMVIPPGYNHPKVDTTKTYRRRYRTGFISRETKEQLEKEMRLFVTRRG
jgi:hypothetical protein